MNSQQQGSYEQSIKDLMEQVMNQIVKSDTFPSEDS